MSSVSAKRYEEAISDVGVGNAIPASAEEDFIRLCVDQCADWLRNHRDSVTSDEVAALFLYHPRGGMTGVPGHLEERFAFHEVFPRKICGHVFYCASTLRKVMDQPQAWDDSDSPLKWLQDNRLLEYCAVVFLPYVQNIFVHRSGDTLDLLYGQSLKGIADEDGSFDLSSIPTLLDEFHDEYTKTPDSSLPMWLSKSANQFRHEAERLIHSVLFAFLKFRIPRTQATTFREVRVPEGREDLEILVKKDGKEFQSSILELKVLYPDKPDEKNKEWARDGIRQLVDYREKRKGQVDVESARLCCYDARWEKAQALQNMIVTESATVNVDPHFFAMNTPSKRKAVAGPSSKRPPKTKSNRN